MSEDLKSLTPDATFDWATAGLFGADNQAAANPSYYNASVVLTALLDLANTWAATQTITPVANTNALVVTGYSLTGANAQSLYDLTATWNTTGKPSAIKLNITDTASDAESKFMDLQIGGVTKFAILKSGRVQSDFFGTAIGGSLTGLLVSGTSVFVFAANGGSFSVTPNSVNVINGTKFTLGLDAVLERDAADVLAQRRTTNAQEQRWYNTFTDASNYERMSLAWSSNIAIMKAQNAGTGSARLFVPVTGATAIGSLPSAATMGAGARSMVNNHTGAVVFGTAPTAGGSVVVPVYSDGTSWLMG